jgi:hypothetical protein
MTEDPKPISYNPIRKINNVPDLYRKILGEAMVARMAGLWDGKTLFQGFDIEGVKLSLANYEKTKSKVKKWKDSNE